MGGSQCLCEKLHFPHQHLHWPMKLRSDKRQKVALLSFLPSLNWGKVFFLTRPWLTLNWKVSFQWPLQRYHFCPDYMLGADNLVQTMCPGADDLVQIRYPDDFVQIRWFCPLQISSPASSDFTVASSPTSPASPQMPPLGHYRGAIPVFIILYIVLSLFFT